MTFFNFKLQIANFILRYRAVGGAVASFIYEYENISKEWITDLRNKELINSICNNYRAIN